ncbi:hypothetical protein DFH11DRAFT_872578 [Phellopilus nigrolimitatus]|nr:hypothetical protein DFH11DRAFT_872578 [Phellopilus nigrolimitatus]
MTLSGHRYLALKTDSDFPPHSAFSHRPSSRAGNIDGSVDEDIWEGFADGMHRSPSESSDERRSVDVDATNAAAEQDTHSLSTSIATRADEDNRINNALNCSVMGTLRASRVRSASSSLHASLTESQSKLRLSFPDPLLRPENDTESDMALQADSSSQNGTTDEHCENIAVEDASSSFADIEAPSMLDVSEVIYEDTSSPPVQTDHASCLLSLVLYGSASLSKWQIAERILTLTLQYEGESPFIVEEGTTRRYYVDSTLVKAAIHAASEQSLYVRVVDRTSSTLDMAFIDADDEVPSLAIVLLPSRLPAILPRHTYYLPLISPPSLDFGTSISTISSAFSEQVMIDSAQYAWDRLEIPDESLISLDYKRPNAILDVAALESLDRVTLGNAFAMLFNTSGETRSVIEREHRRIFANRWYTFAFVTATIFAITIGSSLRMNRNQGGTFTAVNGTDKAAPFVNMTEASPVINGGAVVSISTKQYALAIFHTTPHTPVTATEVPAQVSHASIYDPIKSSACAPSDITRKEDLAAAGTLTASMGSSSACDCQSKSSLWADRFNFALGGYKRKDVMVRPASTVHVVEKAPSSLTALLTGAPERRVIGIDRKALRDGDKSLSLRVVHDSLALVSTMGKALMEVAGKDLQVLYEALDELLQALNRQVQSAKGGFLVAKSRAQSELSYRNMRARANAKRLRSAGERLFRTAGKRFRSGTEDAVKALSKAREGAKKGVFEWQTW